MPKDASQSVLTKVAHGCTPFITVFLIVHLSSPTAASAGGSALSSKIMLLGREYYQTTWGEPMLVLGPIALHVCAGVAKRLLSNQPRKWPRPISAALTLTGYAASILFLPVHYLTHRVYPMSHDELIDAIGPAELDYEFVKYGLQRWPVRSWILYGGLASCVILHSLVGAMAIWKTWFSDKASKNRDTKGGKKPKGASRVVTVSGIVTPVLVGIFALSGESLMAFAPTIQRFEAVFKKSWIYRIG